MVFRNARSKHLYILDPYKVHTQLYRYAQTHTNCISEVIVTYLEGTQYVVLSLGSQIPLAAAVALAKDYSSTYAYTHCTEVFGPRNNLVTPQV